MKKCPNNEALLGGGSTLPAPLDILPRSPCSLPFFCARSFVPNVHEPPAWALAGCRWDGFVGDPTFLAWDNMLLNIIMQYDAASDQVVILIVVSYFS